MKMIKLIKIGTRGSALAQWQADHVIEELHRIDPDVKVEKVILTTQGDKILDKPLVEFGGKGVFVDEFEEAILSGEIDFAIHSAKDMPMELKEGCEIVATLPRADVRDVLVTREGAPINIGTGSLRREYQLKKLYPEVTCKPLRGNVPTRLSKVTSGELDGVVLAAAGLKRLGLEHEPGLTYHYFSPEEMIPAGGQAIIAVEGRADVGSRITSKLGEVELTSQHRWKNNLMRQISDERSWKELEIERYILTRLGAGCHEPIGVYAELGVERSKNNSAEYDQNSVDVAEGNREITIRAYYNRELRTDGCSTFTKKGHASEWRTLADELVKEILG